MTKQELLQSLNSMPSCFFNKEQMIAMLEQIDEQPKEEESSVNQSVLKPIDGVTLNNLLSAILQKMDIENKKKSLLDADKNVFGMLSNKVYLEDYEFNINPLLYDIRLAVVEFFDQNKIFMMEIPHDAVDSSTQDLKSADTKESDEIYVGDAMMGKEQTKWGIN